MVELMIETSLLKLVHRAEMEEIGGNFGKNGSD